jgi:hypothetical protein
MKLRPAAIQGGARHDRLLSRALTEEATAGAFAERAFFGQSRLLSG